MSLNPVMLFDLKPIDPRDSMKKLVGMESVNVSKSRVSLSKSLLEKLGNPEKVEFALDAEKNLFGIKAASPDSKFGFLLTKNKSNCYVSGQLLPGLVNGVRKINLNSRYMILTEPWFESGYYLFDIDKAYIKKIEKRSK